MDFPKFKQNQSKNQSLSVYKFSSNNSSAAFHTALLHCKNDFMR